ncbi:MAG TPA: c-type cytochrome [Rhodanobacteraceae bacterium]|nr:c-type cytochrome [Rhodanobacteraceae bacterium]
MSGAISPSDRTFLRYFSMLIGGLALFLLALLVFAWIVYNVQPGAKDPQRVVAINARLQPVGAVYAGDTGRAAMAAAKAAAAKAAAGQVAYGGTTDGKTIYEHLCTTCHTAGVAGAPKLGDKGAWAPRIAEGIDTLIKHAINGYTGPDGNHMPAKGGNPALTDEQVANTVKWMVAQAK